VKIPRGSSFAQRVDSALRMTRKINRKASSFAARPITLLAPSITRASSSTLDVCIPKRDERTYLSLSLALPQRGPQHFRPHYNIAILKNALGSIARIAGAISQTRIFAWSECNVVSYGGYRTRPNNAGNIFHEQPTLG